MDDKKKLDELVVKAQDSLFVVSAAFPFDFFPNKIRIDENKVDIIYKNFFFDKHLVSILIKNINSVTLSTGIFFATVNFEVSGFVTGYEVKPTPVSYLWKKDAIVLKRIIVGLITATREGVDLANIPKKEKRQKIEEIGKAREFNFV